MIRAMNNKLLKSKPRLKKQKLFPDPLEADINGILAIGDGFEPEILIEAYSFGIFPWPHDDMPLLWFYPRRRGVVLFENFKVNKTFKKFLNKTNFKVTFNKDFSSVIDNCSKAPRKEGEGTWITPNMINVYKELHNQKYAQSVEVWDKDELVGGLYGVYIGGVFSGESMFHKRDNASKFALYSLINELCRHGDKWLDTQMVTPVVKSFGGEYINYKKYYKMIQDLP